MNGNRHTTRLLEFVAAALAAALFVIPIASAGGHSSQRDQDGWYYTALRGTAATSSGAGVSACQTNHTFDQAEASGVLPLIVAALHGSTGPTQGANC